jgi:hypothetical protein
MKISDKAEEFRKSKGHYKSQTGDPYGWFEIPYKSTTLHVLACGADDFLPWDHVSVSTSNRCPNWDEMCFVKDLFFDEKETVVQFHPKKSEYVNRMPYCLHLWRDTRAEHVLPPNFMV